MSRPFIVGDLLYHSVHGICRVNEVAGKSKEAVYTLAPKVPSRMKLRYVVAAKDLGESGFHTPITSREANRILEFLKTRRPAVPVKAPEPGKKPEGSFAENNTTWALAQLIQICSADDNQAKDQKKRQNLQRAATGLVRELAFALEVPLKDAAEKIRGSLKKASRIHPLVAGALENAAED